MIVLKVIEGDALSRLMGLPDESVQCCVTSPPYWGLRDYGTAEWDGGDDGCDHIAPAGISGGQRADRGFTLGEIYKDACGKCGAKRIDSQLGLEKTTEEYVAKMVGVFREVRRVLRKDGTLWLNLGDSYAGNKEGNTNGTYGLVKQKAGVNDDTRKRTVPNGLKPKDLVGIPWRVAFALQADGWWLRQDIIWNKPNPMPESVTDRCTKSHEYLFLLTKSSRYYYDAEAIKEEGEGYGRGTAFRQPKYLNNNSFKNDAQVQGVAINSTFDGSGRNKRSVWTVTTQPYPEAHFATYPPDLIKPCIMAGTKPCDVVLDPFAGSGTTGQVALELGRKAILIELNPKYIDLIQERCSVTPGLALA